MRRFCFLRLGRDRTERNLAGFIILWNDPDSEREVDEKIHSHEDENRGQHILRSELIEEIAEEDRNDHPYVDSHHQED